MPLRLAPALLLLFVTLPAFAQPVTPDERTAVVEQIETLMADRYVFADKGVEAGARLRAQLDAGAYDDLDAPDAFAEALTTDLQAVTSDKHIRVRHRPPPDDAGAAPDPLMQQVSFMERMRAGNYGIAAVEVLDGNIGYLDLRVFPPEDLIRERYDAVMHLLANVNALIVDERQHGGGNPDAIRYLTSYFFDEPTHLNSLHYREGDSETVEEFWTHDDIAGPQRPDLPLFVLTSDYTFSGAEEFAYNLQTRGRATIVGETTGGGANPGGVMPAGERFAVFIPTGRAVNPITGTNWEGVGVTPDVAVPADEALDKALALARPAAEAYEETREQRTAGLIAEIRSGLGHARAAFADRHDGATYVQAALQQGLDAGLLDEGLINGLGYEHLASGDRALATAIFRFNVDAFPDSWNVYDSLGEAYAEQGKTSEAAAMYEKAREMAPPAQHARIDAILSGL